MEFPLPLCYGQIGLTNLRYPLIAKDEPKQIVIKTAQFELSLRELVSYSLRLIPRIFQKYHNGFVLLSGIYS